MAVGALLMTLAALGASRLLADSAVHWAWVATGALISTAGVWAGVPDGAYFYFVHSFYARPSDACHIAGEADYGARFTAAIARDNIFATQFHPEKSAEHGLALYRNFLHWKP